MSRLEKKAAVVTGAGSGIGRAIANLFAEEGASVAILDKDGEAARTVASDIGRRGGQIMVLEGDLGDGESAEGAVAEASKSLGRLDVLVNNAATYVTGDFFEISRDTWQRVLDVNLTAYFLCARAAAREMRRAGNGGSIVNIASVHQKISEPRSGAYAASKGAIAQLTRNLAIEFAPFNIVVNSISPGFIRTRMSIVDGVDETTTARFQELYVNSGRIPLGRAGLPEEVAGAALFLAARECTYMTGADLVVDGGLTITL
jgi:NAD(P)-dependent dehydrogenase (short-subunit alcohol dehydrogenase family)